MQGLDVLATPSPRNQRLLPLLSVLLLALAVGGSALLYRRSLKSDRIIPGLVLGDTRLGAVSSDALEPTVERVAARFLDGVVTLKFGGGVSLTATRRELGARLDPVATARTLRGLGKSGSFLADVSHRVQARRGKLRVPLSLELDRDVALEFFIRLKEEVDRPLVPAKLDLDRQTVIPGREGYLLHVYDCLVATELALRHGEDRVALAVSVQDPDVARQGRRLKDLDISQVLGHYSTVYSLADKDVDRAHNLQVGASKIDGKVLYPGEQMSFNEVVGRRTEVEGYRMAHVINEGELVDGMAGGACQLSSTLFAASFFAGLDLVSSRPHTRPSSYIKMGLDAAVAYPTTDLVIKNPYPFPVVIHYKVNQGKVRVNILGKQRPWRKIVFERELKEQQPFKEVLRKDASIPHGKRVVAQVGVPAFKLVRRRLFYARGKKEPVKTEERELRYPANTQYINEGTGPSDPEWKAPKEHTPFGEVPPTFTVEQ